MITRKKIKIAAAAILAAISLGCHADSAKTEEGLVKIVFQTIKDGNREAFSKLTVTAADFVLKENKVSKFKEQQSFAGGVLKPQQQKQQEEQFNRAVKGGDGQIEFKTAKVRSVVRIDQGNMESLTGGEVPYKIYALELEGGGGNQTETKKLTPYFVVVPWQGEYRLLRLEYMDKQSE